MNKSVISFYTYFFRPSCAIIFLDYSFPWAWSSQCRSHFSSEKKSERDRDSSIFSGERRLRHRPASLVSWSLIGVPGPLIHYSNPFIFRIWFFYFSILGGKYALICVWLNITPQDRHNRPVSYGPSVFLFNLLSKREARDLINQRGENKDGLRRRG